MKYWKHAVSGALILATISGGIALVSTSGTKPVSTKLSAVHKTISKAQPSIPEDPTTNASSAPAVNSQTATQPVSAAIVSTTPISQPTPDQNKAAVMALIDQESANRGYTGNVYYAQEACIDRWITSTNNPSGYTDYNHLVNDPISPLHRYLTPVVQPDGTVITVYYDGAGTCQLLYF